MLRNVAHDLCQKGLLLQSLENWKWKTIAKKQQGLEVREELELKKRGLGAEAIFQETQSIPVGEEKKVETAKWEKTERSERNVGDIKYLVSQTVK